MNENETDTESSPSSNGPLPAAGGVLFGLGVAVWLISVPMGILGAAINGTTSAVANGIFTVWVGIYAVVSGIGTYLVFMSLGSARRAPRGLLIAYVVLLAIGIGACIWFTTLEGAPPNNCEVPPCTY